MDKAMSDGAKKQADPDRFLKLVERIANWTDQELAAVDPAQTRFIAQLVMAGASPDYPPFPPKGDAQA